MNELILATSNLGKIDELSNLLSPTKCIPQGSLKISDTLENGVSFLENALIKARHASLHGCKPALADDSGLVVPALDGNPGIYSSRYAGIHATDEENINLLLQNMISIHEEQREAWFYCAIVLVRNTLDPMPIIATGICKGYISLNPIGKNGFGYDPIFYLPSFKRTMAQLPATIKNRISHRAQALKRLRQLMQSL